LLGRPPSWLLLLLLLLLLLCLGWCLGSPWLWHRPQLGLQTGRARKGQGMWAVE
jgi:hypothetical protein